MRIKRAVKAALAQITILAFLVQIAGINPTFGYLQDEETTNDNYLRADTLDFRLVDSGGTLLPADPELWLDISDMAPSSIATKSASVLKVGGLDFDYGVTATETGGDALFCSALSVDVTRDGVGQYSGALAGMSVTGVTIGGDGQDDWEFSFSLSSSDPALMNLSCSFEIEFDGVQTGSLVGFSDDEKLLARIASGNWSSGVVLYEFLPDPVGADDAPMPGGEWVTLRNNSGAAVDVGGWYLYDADDTHALEITAGNSFDQGGNPTTVIPAGGDLRVYRNGDADFDLDNGGDTLRLFDGDILSGGNLVESYTYVAAPEGNSYVKQANGSWVDPEPTGGFFPESNLDEEASESAELDLEEDGDATPEADLAEGEEATPEADLGEGDLVGEEGDGQEGEGEAGEVDEPQAGEDGASEGSEQEPGDSSEGEEQPAEEQPSGDQGGKMVIDPDGAGEQGDQEQAGEATGEAQEGDGGESADTGSDQGGESEGDTGDAPSDNGEEEPGDSQVSGGEAQNN